MEFIVSCAYTLRGNSVLIKYPIIKEYKYRIVGDKEHLKELYITINSLDELLKLQKKIKRDLIIDKDGELVIYDSCIE